MFVWPVDGSVSRGFDYKSNIYVGGMHAAIDIPAAIGVPFRAVANGVVASVGWDIYSGHFVAVDHTGGWRSLYRHLSALHAVVRGHAVSQGQVVGYSGNTGYTLGPHIHFDLWHRQKQDPAAFYKNGWWAHDPELYLGQGDDMNQAEFNQMLVTALNTVELPRRDEETGASRSNPHTVPVHLQGAFELAYQIEADLKVHKQGHPSGGSEHDHPLTGRTGKA